MDSVSGSMVGSTAFENNYFTGLKFNKLSACIYGQTCVTKDEKTKAKAEAERMRELLDRELRNVCSVNQSGDACRTAVITAIRYIAIEDTWRIMDKDVKRSAKSTFDYLYKTPEGEDNFVRYLNTIDNRADFFGASNLYEKNEGTGVKWFGAAEDVSRAFDGGLGADGNGSQYSFFIGSLSAWTNTPSIYEWRQVAGNTLLKAGYPNFQNLYIHSTDNPIKWDVDQLRNEQKSLQNVHTRYLTDRTVFRWLIEQNKDFNILDYEARVKYGCSVFGLSEKQGCRP
ncbi:hemagglutinin [Advenella kashmirensis W13003]|uniref:Hemagglutinin n=1 Tax=Advenella kashmirensis W13003 TaxID=1424334 RepID=V8QRS4_9BURK|nr:hemagglutinin [Advenella kashmirensis]ETF02010.1 hemagglutinin [Advenella kashmirensis W13003]